MDREMSKVGYTYIYTLPYWIFTEDDDKWEVIGIDYNNYVYRVYRPYRHDKLPFLNTPTEIHTKQIPGFESAQNTTFDPSFYGLPTIGDPLKKQLIYPGHENKLDPKLLPKDSIRIDVLPKTGEMFQPVEADRFINNLMELVRWKTKQWWITRSSHGICRVGAFPFPIDRNSVPVKDKVRPFKPFTAIPLYGDEANLSDSIWKECLASACLDNEQVPVYEMLLLEARYFLASGDIRQATLEASSAVDICKEIIFQRLWCANNPGKSYGDSKRNKLLRNWDYPRHLDVKFSNHFRRSYRQENPQEWSEINYLYEARNNIAHGGPNQYGQPPVVVNEKVCRGFVMASTHCMGWLLELLPIDAKHT